MSNISPKIIIHHNLCTRCSKCVRTCPAEILVQNKTLASNNGPKKTLQVTNPRLCFECRACEVICPVSAINVMCTVSNAIAP
ncbi:MAG: 4Fe-4S binding protein [Candidatus Hodarchaeales archaeon]